MSKINRTALICTKFINKTKSARLQYLFNEAKALTTLYLSLVWNQDTQSYAGKDLYNQIESPLSARFRQECCKKALGIKNSIKAKIIKRNYILTKITKEYNKNPTEKQRLGIEKFKQYTKKLDQMPEIKRFTLDLGANFVSINMNVNRTKLHKNWIHISSLGKYNMNIPFLRTKIFNKWNVVAKLSNFISIDEHGYIKVVFTSSIPYKTSGIVYGCDIGLNKVFSLSSGTQSQPEQNYELPQIHKKICKTVSGSNVCRMKRTQRDQYINYAINRLPFDNIRVLKIEDIKYLKFKKRQSRYVKAWRYPHIFNRIVARCEERGIYVIKVNPANTSRLCNICGWTDKKNRHGDQFKCVKCSFRRNADVSAAINILRLNPDSTISGGDSNIGFYYRGIRQYYL